MPWAGLYYEWKQRQHKQQALLRYPVIDCNTLMWTENGLIWFLFHNVVLKLNPDTSFNVA